MSTPTHDGPTDEPTHDEPTHDEAGKGDGALTRRRLVVVATETALSLAGASLLAAAVGLDPRVTQNAARQPPHPGDRLVLAQGPGIGEPLTPALVPVDGPQRLCWPQDPSSGVLRSERPTNLVLVVRARSKSWLSTAEVHRAAGTLVAYSAVCTHLCCTVSSWERTSFGGDTHGYLLCPCHRSHFEPWDGAKVMSGPAPRPLPALPLRIEDGQVRVAGNFTGMVGCGAA